MQKYIQQRAILILIESPHHRTEQIIIRLSTIKTSHIQKQFDSMLIRSFLIFQHATMTQHFQLMHTKTCQQETKKNLNTSLLMSHCVSVSQEAVSSLTTKNTTKRKPGSKASKFPKNTRKKKVIEFYPSLVTLVR